MKDQVILALDQGTTSSRTIAFNLSGNIVSSNQKAFKQLFPKNAWVEHDPIEIWESQLETINNVLNTIQKDTEIKAIGITNQRETTLVWDRITGQPIYNAIVWQDRRTAEFCEELKSQGHIQFIKDKTGLIIDAYFSASKLKWILDHVDGARHKAEQGELCFGTVDSWLIYNLTNKEVHVTDVSNASRTMLCNIHTLKWDDDLLNLFDIPKNILPEIKSSAEIYGYARFDNWSKALPISGIAGDQQAALFGQMCIQEGMLKNTYGTGCFMLMNTGSKPVSSKNNLLTTVAWKIKDKVTYALEGSVFIGGAAVQWLRDGLNIIKDASEIEDLALQVDESDGVMVVPAFAGLGAPYWDPNARGSIHGITRGTSKAHIARATLEGIALQVYDLAKAMHSDSEIQLNGLRVDGGAAANNLLMQIQSDVFNFKVARPKNIETTALGAAYLAGIGADIWDDLSQLKEQWQLDQVFTPKQSKEWRELITKRWQLAVERSKNWAQID